MDANKHPEYEHESERLCNTRRAIDEYVQEQSKINVVGGDDWATDVLKANMAKIGQEYFLQRRSPYFVRIDFHQDGYSPDEIYFGYRALNLDQLEVVEWRAPLGRLISSSSAERQNIKAPGGTISGNLLLRRRFKISDAQITDISDEFDFRADRHYEVETVSNENYLIEELYTRGDPRLKDIVKTIQKQQDDIIRAAHNTILIVNGVAGSGKTSIAIHRLAYLLFPDNQTNIKARLSIVFCPNKIFLGYISDLLPNLGEKDIVQTTFIDWALQRMGRIGIQKKYKIIDTIQDQSLVSDNNIKEMNRARESVNIKGQIKIKQILERYIQAKLVSLQSPHNGWTYTNLGELGLTLTITKKQFSEIINDVFGRPDSLETKRTSLFKALSQVFDKSYDDLVWHMVRELRLENKRRDADRIQNLAFASKLTKPSTIRLAIEQMEKDFDDWWKPINVIEEYYNLIGNRDIMNIIGKDLLSADEITSLTETGVKENTIELSDIPAIYCFYRMIYTEHRELYDHIVVDEAQDFSPLQFLILRDCIKSGSMTIVGDIAQGINSFRGLKSWGDIKNVFEKDTIQFENIVQSYRSSQEIVELSNYVLRKISENGANLAKPLGRSTGKPKVYITTEFDGLGFLLLQEIERLRKSYQHIAVLVKNYSECQSIATFLNNQNIDARTLNSENMIDLNSTAGIIVIPISLSKGIEFEAVIIFNANENAYSINKEFDGKLLYVAITRALHQLSILSLSPITRYLRGIEDLVELIIS